MRNARAMIFIAESHLTPCVLYAVFLRSDRTRILDVLVRQCCVGGHQLLDDLGIAAVDVFLGFSAVVDVWIPCAQY